MRDRTVGSLVLLPLLHGLVGGSSTDGIVGEVALVALSLAHGLVVVGILVVVAWSS